MPESIEGQKRDRIRPALPDQTTAQETQLESSPRTTLPEIMPEIAHATTLPNQNEATDVRLASGLSAPSGLPSSVSSFTGGLLGRFHYVRTLGEGAFGIVVQVWDPELQAHRAIKVPHRALIDARKVNAESYVREARKLALLGKHPNIVEVLDVQRMNDGVPFVVSEFISGGSLADKIKAERLPWRDSVKLIAQVAEAIAYAHSKGVVHRDLKPANILLTDDDKPVIVDFGLALGDDEFTYRSTTVCGTYQYMSPQQVLGKADRVDGRSDIYSLGVVLYQLVAGRSPYRSRDVKSLKHEIVTDHPAPLRQYSPEVPVELEQICQRAMAKEPADRYSTAADFAAALRAVIKPIPAKAVAPLAAPARRAPWGPIAVGVLGLAILALAALALLPEREAPSPVIPQTAAATPNLQIHFQKHDNESTYSKALADADLPLQVGDKLQFHVAELSKPMYAYIYWINADGDPQRVWPDTNEPLAKQTPVATLSSPPGANDAVNPEWWAVHNVGGPMLFFVGLSEKPLDAEQLEGFEGESSLMRESLLSTMRRSGRPVAEFEYPAQAKTYELRNNELYRTRGGDLHLVISPKVYATDHSQLQKWFSAYHGWIVSARE